jgi:hypothetical protein
LVHEVHYIPGVKNSGNAGTYPGFSVCEMGDSGTLERHAYALLGNVVRRAGIEPCQLPQPVFTWPTAPQPNLAEPVQTPPPPTSPPPGPSLAQRLRSSMSHWFGKK